MTMSLGVVFFGTETFSAPSLQALIDAGYNIKAVVTKPDSKRGRGRKLESPLIKQIAENYGITVLQPAKLNEVISELEALMPATGVLVSYGKIIPQRILDLFAPTGIINVHPSLLPKYRGPAPIEAAILNGDKETGISIMRLTAGMDEGPIFSQTKYPLRGNETKPELYEALSKEGARLLIRDLPAIVNDDLKPTAQQNRDVTYTTMISKVDSILDPATDNAYTLERKVRAYLTAPKARLKINKYDVVVTSAKATTTQPASGLFVVCRDNSYLIIDELIAPSGKKMTGLDFMRGYLN